MCKQKLSNVFKLRIYDLNDVLQHCVENNFTGIVNNLCEVPHQEYNTNDLPEVWKHLLTFKPYEKYSK